MKPPLQFPLAKPPKKSEAEIQAEVLLHIGKVFSDIMRVWRSNTGGVTIDRRFVQFGVPGQGDLSGIMQGGYRIEIEVKREGGRMRDSQVKFAAMMGEYGGFYTVVTSKEQAEAELRAFAESKGVL